MRIRQIKPSWWLDKELRRRLSAEAREFYIGLWMVADDAGWLEWDIERIGAERALCIRKLQKATFKRRDIRGIRLTPESLETQYIPALIEQGTLPMPPLNSAMGNAVLFGRALAIAIYGAERARTFYA